MGAGVARRKLRRATVRSRRVFLPWCAGAALVLSACPAPEPGPPDSGQPDAGSPDAGADAGTADAWPAGTLELGTPASDTDPSFVPLPAALDLHAGPQGGFHVLLLYRVGGGRTEPGARFEHRIRRALDGLVVAQGTRTFDVAPGAGGSWVTDPAVIVFLCPSPPGVDLEGPELSFEIVATRPGGAVLGRVTAKTVLRCPAGSAACANICKG